jgi:hypothetical protein
MIRDNITFASFISYSDSDELFLVDLETFFNIRLILTWLNLSIVILGLILNVFTICKIFKKDKKSSHDILVSGLSFTATIALICILVNNIIYTLSAHYFFFNSIHIFNILFPFTYPIFKTFYVAFIFLTVSISINQSIYIHKSKCFLLKNNKTKPNHGVKTSIYYILSVAFSSVLICLPEWFKFKYLDENYAYKKTEYTFYPYFLYIIFIPFVCCLPMLILIVTNIYIINRLKKAERRKNQLKCNNKLQANIVNEIREQNTKINEFSKVYDISKLNEISKVTNQIYENVTHVYDSTSQRTMTFLSKKSSTPSTAGSITNYKIKNKKNMILISVIFFLWSHIPYLIINIMDSIAQNNNNFISLNLRYMEEVSKVFLILNISFNFSFIYLFDDY